MRYEIKGGSFPVAVVSLDAGETMITQGGGMSWMTPGLQMETMAGGLGKALGRMFSGENLFQNRYTAVEKGEIAFASSLPGDIRPLTIDAGHEYIVQKSGFLASTGGVELSVFFQKKFGTGVFGGEGFIMQKLSGNGIAFVEIDGSAVEYELQAGEKIIADTGHIVLMSSTCTMEIETVKGLKNKLFGGEGFFNTVVTGPGRVILQTMPCNKLAGALASYIVTGK